MMNRILEVVPLFWYHYEITLEDIYSPFYPFIGANTGLLFPNIALQLWRIKGCNNQ